MRHAVPGTKLKTDQVYVSPRREDWPIYDDGLKRYVDVPSDATDAEKAELYARTTSLLDMSREDLERLSLLELRGVFKQEKGERTQARYYNWKKTTVSSCYWKPMAHLDELERLRMDASAEGKVVAAYRWLYANNPTYADWVRDRQGKWKDEVYIATSQLLLHRDGVEVAAYPWLYPRVWFGDTNIKQRLLAIDETALKLQPSIKESFLRKCNSRFRGYYEEYKLIFLLFDVTLARTTIAALHAAELHKISPDVATDNMTCSESYWRHEQDLLCDVVRQNILLMHDQVKNERGPIYEHFAAKSITGDRGKETFKFPNLFITIAPAEWKFLLHNDVLGAYLGGDRLPEVQGPLTQHIHNVLVKVFSKLLAKGGNEYFELVLDYALRVEFQGRGTLHIHIAAWVLPRILLHLLAGRTGTDHTSLLVPLLEDLFGCRVDVQCGSGYLNYINGYVVKSNDSLDFSLKEYAKNKTGDKWLQLYIMCIHIYIYIYIYRDIHT
jgi:hypothetical protein